MSRKNLIGRQVKVTSANECYNSFRDKTLTITHASYSSADHPGYDAGCAGEALCDFVDEEGNKIPNSLYEWEFELV